MKILKMCVGVMMDVWQMSDLSSSLSWSERVFARNWPSLCLLCPGLVRRCMLAFPSEGVSSLRFRFLKKVSSLAGLGVVGVCTMNTVKIFNVKASACHLVSLVHAGQISPSRGHFMSIHTKLNRPITYISYFVRTF